MGGWICLIICVIPICLFYRSGHTTFMMFSIINTVANFWTFGVMHNFAMKQHSSWTEQVQKNRELEGKLDKETKRHLRKIAETLCPEDVPDWLAIMNIVTFTIGISLIALSFFLK